MIQYYYKTAQEEEFQLIPEPTEGCWIHVEEATVENINEISVLTGLEFTDLQDCLDKYEIPRLERNKNILLIFTRYPNNPEPGLETSPLTLILAPHYFITISPQKSPLIKNFLLRKTKISTTQKSKLLIHLLLKITQEFNVQIKKIRGIVLTQEKDMTSVDSEDIFSLTKYEEVFNQYLSALGPTVKVLEAIVSGKYTDFYEKEHQLVEDLVNAVKQSEEVCSNSLKSMRSLRDSYQIVFTNNLHKTIKLLTALTIIFSFPTMIASLYGMNVKLPLAARSNAFILIIVLIFCISLFSFWFFRRKKWL
jgi:magnesium transporter